MGEIETALKLKDEAFKAKYGFVKFPTNKRLIFSCRSGIIHCVTSDLFAFIGARSQKACEIATQLGYSNVNNYRGSANEWFS